MTVPVGLVTVFLLPDTPHTTNAWFLTKEERRLALERVERAGKAAPVPITFAEVKRIFSRWSKLSSRITLYAYEYSELSLT